MDGSPLDRHHRCTRALAHADDFASSPDKPLTGNGLTPGKLLTAEAASAALAPRAASEQSYRQAHQFPPPTDRVIAFRHFLI